MSVKMECAARHPQAQACVRGTLRRAARERRAGRHSVFSGGGVVRCGAVRLGPSHCVTLCSHFERRFVYSYCHSKIDCQGRRKLLYIQPFSEYLLKTPVCRELSLVRGLW